MTTFTITQGTSVQTTGFGEHAFNSDTPGADALIVEAGAHLIAEGAYARGAILGANKPWKVTVAGEITSTQSEGLLLGPGYTGSSTITIASTGSINGGQSGIALNSSAAIINAGEIFGGDQGIMLAGDGPHSVRNTGIIHTSGEFAVLDIEGFSTDTLDNADSIYGNIALAGGNDTLINSADIYGSVDLGDGNDTLANSGQIEIDVRMGNGNDVLKNTKFIDGIVAMEGGNDRLTNSGAIDRSVSLGEGDDTMTNSGTVVESVSLGNGKNTLTNSGQIGQGVGGGTGDDTIKNSGKIAGPVNLGSGDNRLINSGRIEGAVYGGIEKDTVTNSGVMIGTIDLAAGDDVFTGGNGAETLLDGAGSDAIKFGGGNDFYFAAHQGVDGADVIDGGAGLDSYFAGAATGNVYINLDNVAHDLSPFTQVAGYVAANTATGADVAGAFQDTIKGFENADGGLGDDIIYGNSAANYIGGGSGSDTLYGFGGDDVLRGSAGSDSLFGGLGRDLLTGGSGGDFFQFASTADSGVKPAARDTIFDFEDNLDRIDVSTIDANTRNGTGNDTFTFIGTDQAFSGAAGELRAVWTTEGQIVEGDVNGDGKADFAIELIDPNHLITLTSSDFLL
jgi:Ca2+-binding RTX toxin-like protein